ncbi:hypothetical protein TanjilG_02668 [Lupinus angustifolius]|uniref:SMP-30/Gluconolactonase/LRE-like region domain-containing protein n=1 Tax=Lupinus angustifolius TaxID=3871 RepID=A0A4P1RB54_LUPAN|nr:hypothetical protein TanjilG_02668 [Lupinus angustifolius]
MALSSLFSPRFLAFILLLSAIPVAIIVSLERAQPATNVYHYHSKGWLRECSKWDADNNRFIVSFIEGGLGVVPVPEKEDSKVPLEEVTVVKELNLGRNSSFGLTIDRTRNRVLVVYADVLGHRFGAVGAYDLSTWNRIFLTQLADDEKSFANDVAVDAKGNAYVTDVKASKIWKVGVDGELLSIIRNPLFIPKEWYKSFIGLNGIIYHPDGFLIVVQTLSGTLFKIDLTKGEEVKVIKVAGGPLLMGDGLELLSPTKLVVSGFVSRLVESSDGWNSASVVAKFSGIRHRIATTTTIKDGKVYINHAAGMGYPRKKHAIVEAPF